MNCSLIANEEPTEYYDNISNPQEILEKLRYSILSYDTEKAATCAKALAKKGLNIYMNIKPMEPKEDSEKTFP